MNEVDAARALIESIARSEFGASWGSAIVEINTSGLFSDTNRVLVVRVNSYTNLELLAEQAKTTFGFTIDNNLVHEGSIVGGQWSQDWTVIRTWWFDLTDTDRGDPETYPYATPKGVSTRFSYTETRKATP